MLRFFGIVRLQSDLKQDEGGSGLLCLGGQQRRRSQPASRSSSNTKEAWLKDVCSFRYPLVVERFKRAGGVLGHARHGFWQFLPLSRVKLFCCLPLH